MQVGACAWPAVRAMFANLIDYAGLFPPARLAMQQAVAEYEVERRGKYAWMLGRFIVPHSRVPELRATLDAADHVGLSLILDRGMDSMDEVAHRLRGESPLVVEALEIVLEPERIDEYAHAAQAVGLLAVPSYVEFARDASWESTVTRVMAALAGAGLGAKVRCGGLTPHAFPTPRELAIFIYVACNHGVPFKATAGLHHPIRHFDEVLGVHRHGFLNILSAAALARGGADVERLTDVLACEDRAQFQVDEGSLRFGDRGAGVDDLQSMRREAFIAYGSCSFSEPVDDLRNLNLLS